MTKLLNELNENELKKVWDNNKKLRNKVEKSYTLSEMDYISELLKPIKNGLSDWDIGFYNNNDIKINLNKTRELYQGIEEAQSMYGVFSEETYKILLDCFDNNNYNRIRNILLDTFNDYTKAPDNDMVYSYFIEYYIDLLDDSYYVDSDYILYQPLLKAMNRIILRHF